MKLYIDTTYPNKVKVEIKDKEKIFSLERKSENWTSQILLPAIKEVMEKNGISFSDYTEVYVNPGPGSFTGIRVGVAVAQTIAYLLHIPLNGKLNNMVEPIYGENDKFGKMAE